MLSKKNIFLLLITLLLPLYGEVFTLQPYKGDGKISESKLKYFYSHNKGKLFSEEMLLNNNAFELEGFSLDISYADLLNLLNQTFNTKDIQLGDDFIRASNKIADGTIERFIFLHYPNKNKTIMFRAVTPEKLPLPTQWPDKLPPLPMGATIDQVIEMPNRNAVYGSFKNGPPNPEFLLSSLVESYKSEDYFPLSDEYKNSEFRQGEILFRKSPKSFIWINFSPNGQGAYYHKGQK